MGLLSRLLSRVQSVINGDDDRSREWERDPGDGTVTVEHESTLSEETGTAPSGGTSDETAAVVEDETNADGADDAVEPEDTTDDAGGGVDAGTGVDSGDGDGARSGVETASGGDAEVGGANDADAAADVDADADSAADDEGDAGAADATASQPVDAIKGVGPAYRTQLEGAGVGTVAELADADADALAAETDLSAARIANWIERARSRRE